MLYHNTVYVYNYDSGGKLSSLQGNKGDFKKHLLMINLVKEFMLNTLMIPRVFTVTKKNEED